MDETIALIAFCAITMITFCLGLLSVIFGMRLVRSFIGWKQLQTKEKNNA